MLDILREYIPRACCMHYEQGVIWTSLLSDATIAISYFVIPISILFLITKKKDIKGKSIYILFCLFIILCGITHVMGVIAIWHSYYRLDALFKVLTAIASLFTALLLPKVVVDMIRKPKEYTELSNTLNETNIRLKEVNKWVQEQ